MKIIFAGTPELALPVLDALIKSPHEIVAVYTQPDRPSGRGRHLHESPIKQLAHKNNIPVYQPEKLKEFPHEDIDLFIVAIYGLIIPEFILHKPKYGCINVHLSLLPRWRGAAPIHRAILAGDTETGITIMQMEKGLDTGDILAQKNCPILPTDNSDSLANKLGSMGAKLLLDTLKNIDHLTPLKQDESLTSYAQKINKLEGNLHWDKSAEDINRQIRAFHPAYTYLDGQLIKIWSAEPLPIPCSTSPGTIMDSSATGIDVSTGENILRITKLQLAGGKPLSVREILNSRAKLFEKGKRFFNSHSSAPTGDLLSQAREGNKNY